MQWQELDRFSQPVITMAVVLQVVYPPTPESGTPRKNRAAINPAAFLLAAMHMTIAPPVAALVSLMGQYLAINLQQIITAGKNTLAEVFLSIKIEGSMSMVMTK